jgi:hypothetical protein
MDSRSSDFVIHTIHAFRISLFFYFSCAVAIVAFEADFLEVFMMGLKPTLALHPA